MTLKISLSALVDDHDDDSSLVNRIMFLNDHQQHALLFIQLRRTTVCVLLSLISLKLVGRNKRETERWKRKLVRTALVSYRYTPLPAAHDLLHMCRYISLIFLMRSTRKRWRSILFSLCMCLLMISSSLLKYSIDLSHTCVHLIKFIWLI